MCNYGGIYRAIYRRVEYRVIYARTVEIAVLLCFLIIIIIIIFSLKSDARCHCVFAQSAAVVRFRRQMPVSHLSPPPRRTERKYQYLFFYNQYDRINNLRVSPSVPSTYEFLKALRIRLSRRHSVIYGNRISSVFSFPNLRQFFHRLRYSRVRSVHILILFKSRYSSLSFPRSRSVVQKLFRRTKFVKFLKKLRLTRFDSAHMKSSAFHVKVSMNAITLAVF